MTTSFEYVKHFKDVEPIIPPEAWLIVRDKLEREQGITYFKMFYLPAMRETIKQRLEEEPLFPIE